MSHHSTTPFLSHPILSGFASSALTYVSFEHPMQVKSLRIPNIPVTHVIATTPMGIVSRGIFGSVLFGCYSFALRHPMWEAQSETARVALGALIGSLLGSFISLPFEKERIAAMATQHGHSSRWSLQRGKYRGIMFISAQNALFYTMQFALYNHIKRTYFQDYYIGDSTTGRCRKGDSSRYHGRDRLVDMGAAFASGSVVGALVYPFDRFFSHQAQQPFGERISAREFFMRHFAMGKFAGFVPRMGTIAMMQWGAFEAIQELYRWREGRV